MAPLLLREVSNDVARLTLNRPEARNALNRQLRGELATAFRELRDEVRVVILTGAGTSFCAGFDLAELASGAAGGNAAEAGSDISSELIPAIANFPGPIIAAVNGPAVTAGFELALACDMIIASTEASFGDTHVRVGILPGWGLSQRLPRLIGINRAKELSYTGNFLDAEKAERWGLVNRVVAAEDLVRVATGLARDMLSADSHALPAYKQLIDSGYAMNFAEATRHEAAVALASAARLNADTAAQRKKQLQQRREEQTTESGRSSRSEK